jgi:hypothetical protein
MQESPADLEARLAALQNARVEEWLRLVRHGDIIPSAVERSVSWRLTRPVRLAQTAAGVLRRDGLDTFRAIAVARLRRMAGR